jgi:hypothetical protein
VVSIIFTKTGSKESGTVDPINDFILWYARDKKRVKLNKLFEQRSFQNIVEDGFKYLADEGNIVQIPENYIEDRIVCGLAICYAAKSP